MNHEILTGVSDLFCLRYSWIHDDTVSKSISIFLWNIILELTKSKIKNDGLYHI